MSSDAMADCAVMLAAATLPTLCRVWQSQTPTSLLSWTMALPGVVSLLRCAQISINTTSNEPAYIFPLYMSVELMGLLTEMQGSAAPFTNLSCCAGGSGWGQC